MVIVAVFALLALFSFISIALSAEDPRGHSDPRDNPLLWGARARRVAAHPQHHPHDRPGNPRGRRHVRARVQPPGGPLRG